MTLEPRKPLAKEIWKEVDATFVGFEKFFEQISGGTMKPIPSFPPYNVRHYGDHTLTVEVATAGFDASELNVEVNSDKLSISGKKSEADDDSGYTHKGIAARNFDLSFKLAENLEVISSTYVNGLLTVSLKRLVPENPVRKIAIEIPNS